MNNITKVSQITAADVWEFLNSSDTMTASDTGSGQQFAPFDVRIAQHTGIGRASPLVFLHEIGNHMVVENLPEVQDMVFNA